MKQLKFEHEISENNNRDVCVCERERERGSTSMIIYQDMFLAQLGTILETDLISMIWQTIFHKLLM
jgi:hypothetical protein